MGFSFLAEKTRFIMKPTKGVIMHIVAKIILGAIAGYVFARIAIGFEAGIAEWKRLRRNRKIAAAK